MWVDNAKNEKESQNIRALEEKIGGLSLRHLVRDIPKYRDIRSRNRAVLRPSGGQTGPRRAPGRDKSRPNGLFSLPSIGEVRDL